jgi:acetylornithine deacetylase/succinyl-diaminopimelate desuccinylase-like protein
MTDSLATYLENHARDAQTLLEQLARQPSVTAQNWGTAEMADMVERLLSETGFALQRLYADDAPPFIYGELKGTSDYTVLLYNHYDVQPPEPYELWHTPPFEPTVRDGKLYARGVSDNKSEFAARLTAIRALLAVNGSLPVTLRWIIEGEEEVGSPHFGAMAQKYSELLKADGGLWEGSSFDVTDRPEVTLGAKGLLYVQLDVDGTGIDAHSGNAPILPSAAWRLVQALASLRSPGGRVLIPGFYDAVRRPSPEQQQALDEQTNEEDALREAYGVTAFNDNLTGVELRTRYSFSPTCNIAGLLSGYTGEGTKTVLPAKAMAKIDFRLVPDQTPDDILAKLRAHLEAQGYTDIRVTVFGRAQPTVSSMNDPFVRRILSIVESYEGTKPSITPISGGSLPLLEPLTRYVGLPGLSAPGNASYWASAAHAPNEHIRLSDLERAVRFNCHMFQRLGSDY